MNTRIRCVAPAQSIAILQASCASWPEPASFPDPGEAYCSLRDHSITEQPTSTAGPHQRALRDRRDARMDALDIRNVLADAQTLAIGQGQFRRATARIARQFVSASLASAAGNWQGVTDGGWPCWSFVAPNLTNRREGKRLNHLGGQIAP